MKGIEASTAGAAAARSHKRYAVKLAQGIFLVRFSPRIIKIALPVAATSLLLALCIIWSQTIIEVPERPAPGGSFSQLPDSQYIEVALSFAALTKTYRPEIAREQFLKARRYLSNNALETYTREIELELHEIESRQLFQTFGITKRKIFVDRYPEEDRVVVTLPGEVIGSAKCSSARMLISLATIPKNPNHDFGVGIQNYQWTCFDEERVPG